MKKSSFFRSILVATVILFATTASAQVVNVPSITMQASAERQVTPDEIYISITIRESDYKGKKTLEEMQQAMLGVLKRNRIDIPECLSMNFMGSNVSYTTFRRKPVPQSQATYTLKLYDTSIMQDVIYGLEEVQISNIRLVETKYTKEDSLRNELGIEAMKKAQAEAAALAGAVGQEIGKAISISSWNSHIAPQPLLYKSRNTVVLNESADSSSPEQQISIAKLTFTVNVDVRFELK